MWNVSRGGAGNKDKTKEMGKRMRAVKRNDKD